VTITSKPCEERDDNKNEDDESEWNPDGCKNPPPTPIDMSGQFETEEQKKESTAHADATTR